MQTNVHTLKSKQIRLDEYLQSTKHQFFGTCGSRESARLDALYTCQSSLQYTTALVYSIKFEKKVISSKIAFTNNFPFPPSTAG